jgi:hypothetical protein
VIESPVPKKPSKENGAVQDASFVTSAKCQSPRITPVGVEKWKIHPHEINNMLTHHPKSLIPAPSDVERYKPKDALMDVWKNVIRVVVLLVLQSSKLNVTAERPTYRSAAANFTPTVRIWNRPIRKYYPAGKCATMIFNAVYTLANEFAIQRNAKHVR